MAEHTVERPRNAGEIDRLDEYSRVADVPAVRAAQETAQLRFDTPPSPRRLLLESAEGPEVALGVKNLFDRGGTERANELVLEVCDTNEEAQPFHIGPSEVGAEAGSLQASPKHLLLACVTEAREPRARPRGTEPSQEASHRLRTPDRHDRDLLAIEIATTARSESLKRNLVADPFDEHDRTWIAHSGKRPPRRLRTPGGRGLGPPTRSRGVVRGVD